MDKKKLQKKIDNCQDEFIKEMFERAMMVKNWGRRKNEWDTYYMVTGWFYDESKERQILESEKNRG